MPGGDDTTIPLRVPPLRETHDPAVERSERRVREWVAELPVLNPVACLDALLDALEPLNREPLAPGTRLALMEAYRPAVLAVLRGMDARTLRRLPLAPEARAEARARLVRLCEAQAAGYKHVVRTGLRAGRAPGSGDATLDAAWFRALEHAGWVLASAWRARQDPPPFTWLELHQLHARLAAREVALAAPAGEQPQAVERACARVRVRARSAWMRPRRRRTCAGWRPRKAATPAWRGACSPSSAPGIGAATSGVPSTARCCSRAGSARSTTCSASAPSGSPTSSRASASGCPCSASSPRRSGRWRSTPGGR